MKKEGKNISQKIGKEQEFFGECLICYEHVAQQGVIECCEHIFCFSCIWKWAQEENCCPLCKKRFNSIKRRIITSRAQISVPHRMSAGHIVEDSQLIEIPDATQNPPSRRLEDIQAISIILQLRNILRLRRIYCMLRDINAIIQSPQLFSPEMIPIRRGSSSEDGPEQESPPQIAEESCKNSDIF